MSRYSLIAALCLAWTPVALAESAATQATITASVLAQPAAAPHKQTRPLPSSVLWLVPVHPTAQQDNPPAHGPYILMQKNRMFIPHVLVVPVGTAVSFPNADPFFHNVFSLYDGKRFDLGLYEKGSNRQVIFNRIGVSYIFCNIHPEMSAVVLALNTPWWARSESNGSLKIEGVPSGDYEAHLWVEGADAGQLEHWTHPMHVTEGVQSAGTLVVDPDALHRGHLNKFEQPYTVESHPY